MAGVDEPARAPEIRRRVEMSRHRWLGLAFLLVLPLLNLAHVFQARAVSMAVAEPLQLRVAHPSRALAFDTENIEVVATTTRDCKALELLFDPTFLAAVEELRLLPQVHEGYVLEAPLRAGRSLRALLEFRAKHAGVLHGDVQARCDGGPTATVRFSMLIFP